MTQEEVRDAFLEQIWVLIHYWDGLKEPHGSRVEGVVHSILCMLDGVQGAMPAFEIYPSPHPEDKDYHRSRDDDWWPELESHVSVHGNSMLHELFYGVGRRLGYMK